MTRVESSHSVKNVTRVESSHYFYQRDSSRVRVTKNRDSSRVIDSSPAITVFWRVLLFFSWLLKKRVFFSVGSNYIKTEDSYGCLIDLSQISKL